MTYEGNCRLGDLFTSRREKGRPGLPTLSVTLNDGLVNREDMERKQDTSLAPDEHLLVKPGDIAYNMMRMWQGAFGLADREGLVSPAYVVLKGNGSIDPLYASYLFKTARMKYLFWAYSYGLTDDRLRLYFPDFAKIPAKAHGAKKQKHIAKILATWEAALLVHRRMLDNSRAMKAAALSRLLRFRKHDHSKGWNEYEFCDVAQLVRQQFDPKKNSQQQWCVELEHIDQGTGALLGSNVTNIDSSTKNIFTTDDLLFGKLRPYLRKYWLAQRSGVCSSEIWVLRAKRDLCSPEFLACLVQTEAFMRTVNASAGSKMPRAEWDYVERTPVMLPSLKDQLKISTILRVFDLEIAKRQDQVVSLEAERQSLLQEVFNADLPTKAGMPS